MIHLGILSLHTEFRRMFNMLSDVEERSTMWKRTGPVTRRGASKSVISENPVTLIAANEHDFTNVIVEFGWNHVTIRWLSRELTCWFTDWRHLGPDPMVIADSDGLSNYDVTGVTSVLNEVS